MKKLSFLMGLFCLSFSAKAETIHQIFVHSSVVPSLSTTQYGAGQQMGQPFLMNIGDRGAFMALKTLRIVDDAKQAPGFDVLFFNDQPSMVSVDGGALDITDNEMDGKFIGLAKVVPTDYRVVANSSVAHIVFTDMAEFKLKNNSTGIWGVMRSNGSPTFISSDGLKLDFYFRQD